MSTLLTPTHPAWLRALGTLPLCLLLACRPGSDDPATRIDDPDAELVPAQKRAKETKKKKNKKKRDEAKARQDRKLDAARGAKGDKKAKAAKQDVKPKPDAPASKARVGEPAPAFTLKDLQGQAVSLESFKGKTVVLEWFNPECPFVKYAHGEKGPLRTMAATNAEKGIVWLSINSGAEGKQGNGLELNQTGAQGFAMSNPVLLDEDGAVGRSYGAKTTPHIFVIDARGVLAYVGAVDNAPRGELEGEYEAFAQLAIDAVAKGEAPTRTETVPYGCSVKYAG